MKYLAVSTFRDFIRVCKALGLKLKALRNDIMYSGYVNGKYCSIPIHKHAEGRDIATGTFNGYVKELGFKNTQEYFEYLNKI